MTSRGAKGARGVAVAVVWATLSSCAHLPSSWVPAPLTTQPHLVALDAQSCRALLRDDAPAASLQQAAARSVQSLQRLPQDRMLPALDHEVRVGEVVSVLAAVADMTSKGDGWGEQVCDRFHVYRAELPQPMLVTGYYQPELAASRRRTERFRYPLYRTPDDLVDVDLSQFC